MTTPRPLPNQAPFDAGYENLFGETLVSATVSFRGKVINLVLDAAEGRYYMNQTGQYYDQDAIGRILANAEKKGAYVERFWK